MLDFYFTLFSKNHNVRDLLNQPSTPRSPFNKSYLSDNIELPKPEHIEVSKLVQCHATCNELK